MPKVKFCGLKTLEDIRNTNLLGADFAGFVFAKKSKRYIDKETAARLRNALSREISAVGVFVDEDIETVAGLLNEGIIDMAQLHGSEDDDYIRRLKKITGKPVIKAFRITSVEDVDAAEKSIADHILLDAGAGEGRVFDWSCLDSAKRPYFLAGGLSPENVSDAIERLHPFALDVSSGIETRGSKDHVKMEAFMDAVRHFKK
ncbi:MAG: phosphoribosylanthranilate isomerase [Lachnospiraceae bacterium]|nr:phosphoribosylanthranilate isomerase [Lachnospiraceae bacterium]